MQVYIYIYMISYDCATIPEKTMIMHRKYFFLSEYSLIFLLISKSLHQCCNSRVFTLLLFILNVYDYSHCQPYLLPSLLSREVVHLNMMIIYIHYYL